MFNYAAFIDVATGALAVVAMFTLGVYVWLGMENRRLVKAANEEAEAVRRQTDVALEQVEVSRRTLDAQFKPALIDMPVLSDADLELIFYPQRRDPLHAKPGAVHTWLIEDDEVMCSIPFRSAGRGLAIINGISIDFREPTVAPHVFFTRTNLPPGDNARVNIRATPADPSWNLLAEAMRGAYATFSVGIGYTDMVGGQRTLSRFEIHRHPAVEGEWFVRQVLFFEPGDDEPYAGSAPVL